MYIFEASASIMQWCRIHIIFLNHTDLLLGEINSAVVLKNQKTSKTIHPYSNLCTTEIQLLEEICRNFHMCANFKLREGKCIKLNKHVFTLHSS